MSSVGHGVDSLPFLAPSNTADNVTLNNTESIPDVESTEAGGSFSDALKQQPDTSAGQSNTQSGTQSSSDNNPRQFSKDLAEQSADTVDAGKFLQQSGELLPGLMPGSEAGWAIRQETMNGDQALQGATFAAMQEGHESLEFEQHAADNSELLGLADGVPMPMELAQQTAWQTPAAIVTGDSATLKTVVNARAGHALAANEADTRLVPFNGQGSVEGQNRLSQLEGSPLVSDAVDGDAEELLRAVRVPLSDSATEKGAVSLETTKLAAVGQQGEMASAAIVDAGVLKGKLLSSVLGNSLGKQFSTDALKSQIDGIKQALNVETATPTTAQPRVEGAGSYQQAVVSGSFQTAVATQVASPGWGDTVMQRVMWMSSQQIRSAEIQLDPPELGSLQVKINTTNEQTSVTFTSAHGSVRDALDQSLPRLREMMEEQGLDLVNVDVSEHSRQDKANDGEVAESDSDQGDVDDSDDSVLGSERSVAEMQRPLGLVDDYA